MSEREERLSARMQKAFEEMMAKAFMPMTSATAEPGPSLTPERYRAMAADWGKMLLDYRRNQVTVTVQDGHIGAPEMYLHPTDGTFIECSYVQAAEIHKECPLVLANVASPDRAEFTVASPLHGFIPTRLPMPPYDMPEEIEEQPAPTAPAPPG